MIKYIYKAIFLSLFCLILVSCKKDFLNIIPQGKQVASKTNDYSLMMNDPRLSQFSYSGGWQGPMIMGDDIAAEASYYKSDNTKLQTIMAFQWADNLFQPGETDFTMKIWLENLYQINKVINEVMASTGGTEQQKMAIMAEAQASRAWIYFQFVNFFGKPYSSASAATDLGFPIILTSDITVTKFTRATVQEVYDFIIKDFTAAIANLPINSANGIHFNKAAAEGLLGKIYLFMGKNTEALTLFNAAFVDNAARSAPATLYDYNKEFDVDGKFMPITSTGPNNSPGIDYNDFTESIVSKSFYNYTYGGNGYSNDAFVLTPAARGLFGASDLRLNFYAPEFPYNEPNPSGRLRKYGVQYTQFGLQISELYLLRAEVKARLNDLGGAQTDLVALRSKRMNTTDAEVPSLIASNQTDLIKYIFEERIREFAMEGYRWFDMRRESVDPIFSGKTYTHTLYNGAAAPTVFTLNPVRLTLRLPYFIYSTNPDLPNNP